MGLFSDCKQMVKYSGTNIQIASAQGPITVPVKIEGIGINPKLLQVAGRIMQVLDWLQYSQCQRIRQLRKLKDIPQETIIELILKQDENAHKIANVAILSIAYCDSPEKFQEVLADWISAALPSVEEGKTHAQESEKMSHETKKSEEDINIIEKELFETEKIIRTIDDKIKSLKRELKDVRYQRNKLRIKKEEFQNNINLSSYTMNLIYEYKEPTIKSHIDEAVEEYPYLLKAIEQKKPFNINESLAKLRKQE